MINATILLINKIKLTCRKYMKVERQINYNFHVNVAWSILNVFQNKL